VSGQITGAALATLDEHVRTCDECRMFLQDFGPFKAHVAPVIAGTHMQAFEPPEGMRSRFLERAAASGISLQAGPAISLPAPIEPAARQPGVFSYWGSLRDVLGSWYQISLRYAAAAAVCVACIGLGYGFALSQLTITAPLVPAPPSPSLVPGYVSEATHAVLNRQLEVLEADHARSHEEIASLSNEMMRAVAEKKRLESEVARAGEHFVADQQKLKAEQGRMAVAEQRVQALQTALDEERRKVANTDAVLILQQRATEEALNRAADLRTELEHERDNKMASGEFAHLVAARNLHIIDVYDTEGDGKRQRAFGRVFYVEGQSLIYYAYDLSVPRKDTKFSFRLWGETAGVKSASYSLGVLQSDEKAGNRWVLTCNDPRVLTRINAVYITTEASGTRDKTPRGRKLMYAFLGNPNHP
jgi:hypothetical protein